MDDKDFDYLTRTHITGASRRGVVAGLGRGLAAALSLGLLGSASVAEADAKGRRKKHKQRQQTCPPCRQRTKHGKCETLADGTACAGGTCQAGSCAQTASPPPPPPPPPETGPGSCSGANLSNVY